MEGYEDYLKNTSVLQILYQLKQDGFPTNEQEQALLFKKFNIRNNGDYHVHWEDLCDFIPEVEDLYGQEKYVELHRIYDLQGELSDKIKNSGMSEVEKEFLYFVYEI